MNMSSLCMFSWKEQCIIDPYEFDILKIFLVGFERFMGGIELFLFFFPSEEITIFGFETDKKLISL